MITDYSPLYSYALLTLLALFLLIADTATGRRRGPFLGWTTAAGAVAALALDWRAEASAPWNGLVVFDGFSRAFNVVFLATLALVSIGSAAVESRIRFAGEHYALLVLATIGLMLTAASGGLLALYLGVELSVICLLALSGFAKREKRSAEASLKMLVLSAVASAMTLYGASLVFGAVRTTQFAGIAEALVDARGTEGLVLWTGLALVLGGLAFKMTAAPFHLWAPDVYEGAPAAVAAFLSTASKAGGFAALLRVLFQGFGETVEGWLPVVFGLAALSMIAGNLAALAQKNLKRLLAYSGVAQAGYLLVAVAGLADPGARLGVSACLMYLLLYAFTNVAGFLVAQEIAVQTGSDQVTALRGLHRRSPALAFVMLIVLFSLGGIPPLAGFVGKLYLFAAGWEGGQTTLVVVGALVSVIALYYYLMVALQVYIRDPADDRRMKVGFSMGTVLAICTLGTIAIGVYPKPWVDLGNVAARYVGHPEQFITMLRSGRDQVSSLGR